jgi:NAD(P)-dependent dehydrogenase (short-subunit alcohol dehydrogenase family)
MGAKNVLQSFRLDGRVALVTGASKNIGLSLAHGLAEVGADILAVARDGDRLERAAAEIRRASGRRVETVVGDIGNKEDIERIVAVGLSAFERMDVLVLNAYSTGYAGRDFPIPVTEISDEQWDEAYRTNVLGNYRLIRGFAPALMAHGVGSVISVLSGSGFLPNLGMTCYGSTKAALWQMTKYLAKEEPRIRFNALTPGLVNDTGKVRSVREESVVDLIPMKRVGHPDEMIGACVYLASDAASYTTGEVLFCNGGRPWG